MAEGTWTIPIGSLLIGAFKLAVQSVIIAFLVGVGIEAVADYRRARDAALSILYEVEELHLGAVDPNKPWTLERARATYNRLRIKTNELHPLLSEPQRLCVAKRLVEGIRAYYATITNNGAKIAQFEKDLGETRAAMQTWYNWKQFYVLPAPSPKC